MSQRNESPARWGIVVGLTLMSAVTSAAQTYNAADDFSISQNPNGAWSYGWAQSLGAAFNQYTQAGQPYSPSIDSWYVPTYLNLSRNRTGQPVNFGSATIPPHALWGHPGPNREYTVLRWTAALAGPRDISATFQGIDVVGTSTDVHVLHNNLPLFSGLINGYADAESFSGRVDVLIGDHLDLMVGVGSNGNYFSDSTSFNLIIIPPCPGDLDGDRDIDLTDLATLLAHFGTQEDATLEDGDQDRDGDVDLTDLALVLANFGTPCP